MTASYGKRSGASFCFDGLIIGEGRKYPLTRRPTSTASPADQRRNKMENERHHLPPGVPCPWHAQGSLNGTTM